MKHWKLLVLALLFSSFAGANPNSKDVFEETLYANFQQQIIDSHKIISTGITPEEQSLFVDALWDLIEDENQNALRTLETLQPFHFDLLQKLRIGLLKLKYHEATSLPVEVENELMSALLSSDVDIKIIYTLAAYEDELLKSGHQRLIDLAKIHDGYFDISEEEREKSGVPSDIVADLFYNSPDITAYMNGEYVKSVKVFMFCRTNRLYPCLMTMRDAHGVEKRNDDGSLWVHPSLASSARGLPTYTRNGHTPAGVWTIDSVMPYADQQISFGKYRRMIINFIPKSKDETLMKSLLPASSHNHDWWKQTITARDIGRNLFRIHGTGKLNQDPTTPYYPFMRTSGCIAQRENTYDGITYKDQQDLLNNIMKAQDLNPRFENEVKVKGILYVMELDDVNAPVTALDLAQRGIE